MMTAEFAKLAVLMTTAFLLTCQPEKDLEHLDAPEPDDRYCPDPDPAGAKLSLLEHYIDSLFGAPSGATSGPGAAVEIADLDHDDVLDVIVTRGQPHEPGAILVYYGNRDSGEFELGAPLVLHHGPTYSQGALGDVDRDGCLDLVVGFEKLEHELNGGVHVFMAERVDGGERPCRFKPQPLTLVRSPLLPGEGEEEEDDAFGVADVALGDYDADGELDLAVAQVHLKVGDDYRKPVAQSIYPHLGDWISCEPAGTCPASIVTDTAISGNSSVEFLDVDRNGKLDLLFVGVGAFSLMRWDTWGVVKLDDGTELEVLLEPQVTQLSRLPHAVDLEVLPNDQNKAQVAVLFSRHKCSSGCGPRASAFVFELPSIINPDEATLHAEQLWTAKDGCRGNMTRIAAGRFAGDEHLDLVFGWFDSKSLEGLGKLILVEGRDGLSAWEPIDEAEHASADRYANQSFQSWVLEVSDLDGSDTTNETKRDDQWTGRRVVELPDVIHHAPRVTCDGAPITTNFTPGTHFVILAEECGSTTQPKSLAVEWKKERAGDILYIPMIDPENDPDSQTQTLRGLRYQPVPE